jgi:hypothetical protein
VEEALGLAYEVSNYPAISTHLASVLAYRLRNSDEGFLEISGFRLGRTGELYALEPNLELLGTYEDWLKMKQAGMIYPSKKHRGASGWRHFYIQFLKASAGDVNRNGHVYPGIMQARLAWGEAEHKAPYWYWYDQEINTSLAYPTQTIVDISYKILLVTQLYCRIVNSSVGTDEGEVVAKVEFDWQEYGEDVAETVESFYEGNYNAPVPDPEDYFHVFGGRYKKRQISDKDVLRLINEGVIRPVRTKEEAAREGKLRVNLVYTKTGRFTGLYAILEKK